MHAAERLREVAAHTHTRLACLCSEDPFGLPTFSVFFFFRKSYTTNRGSIMHRDRLVEHQNEYLYPQLHCTTSILDRPNVIYS